MVAVLVGAHAGHIDLLVGDDRAEVAQQADPVPGLDFDRDGEELAALARLASMLRMRAWGTGLRSTLAYPIPGSRISPA